MKKNYFRLMTLSLGLAFSFTAFSQADVEANTKTFTADEKAAILSGVQKNPLKTPNNKTHCEDTITTPLLSGNGQDGVMFDVVVGSSDITVETFWVSIDATDMVAIYYRTGTFVGNETSSAGWIFLDSASTAGTGDGQVAQVPVSLGLALTNGTTYAFYVTTINGGMNYTNGTTVGATLVSNADLSVLEGNGGSYPFSVTFTPRTFNGRVQYCLPATGITEVLGSNNVSMFPNPATSELNINLPSLNGEKVNVEIYNVIGELIVTNQIVANGSTNRLDVSELNTGIYFVKVIANGSEYSTKLLIE